MTTMPPGCSCRGALAVGVVAVVLLTVADVVSAMAHDDGDRFDCRQLRRNKESGFNADDAPPSKRRSNVPAAFSR